jgi:hypothetical protein
MGQQAALSRKVDYSAPPVEGDFYRIANLLNDSEKRHRQTGTGFYGGRGRADH